MGFGERKFTFILIFGKRFIMDTYKIYCGGEFIETSNAIEVKNKYNNKVIAKTWLADRNELEVAIKKAEIAFEKLNRLASYEKYDILMQVASELDKSRTHLAQVLAQEAAKPIKMAQVEIERTIQVFIASAEECKRLPGELLNMDWTKYAINREGIVKYFPIGLVAGISPFNFPMNLAVHKIAPAIAAGCSIILKPATATPLSTLELAKILDKTPLPKGCVSILPMNRAAGNLLVTDERIKLLTFTGSPLVGWKMKNDAGKKKVVLELGGNAGAIITASADMDWAVKRAVMGAFSYAGQVCIHTQRLFVHQSIYEVFVNKFIEETKKLNHGDPLNSDTDISVLIDEENAIRVEQWIEEAVNKGAKVLYGGKRMGNMVHATILTHTTPEMKVNAMEVFGPIITVEKYADFTEAVKAVNNTNYGLQAGVFTNDIREMDYAFYNLHVGGVIINDVPTFRADHMPYGGIKDSGLGREGIKYAIMDMLEPKILVKNTNYH